MNSSMTATTLLHRLDHLHGELHVNFTSSSARVGNRGHGLFVEIFRKSLVEVWENRAEERDHGVQPKQSMTEKYCFFKTVRI